MSDSRNGQGEGDTQRLLRTLPLPLAQLLRRAVNAKSSVERHNNAYYLAEAALKLAAAARIGVWLERALDTKSDLARALEALTLPSAGHWLSLLRDLDAALGKRADAGLLPLASTFGELSRKTEGWSAVSDLATAAAEASAVPAEVAKAASRDGILGFFGLVVAYRNAVLGHGAQRRGSFYERFEDLWLKALVCVLDAPAMFGGLRLAYTRLDKSDKTAWQDLTGIAGFPMTSPPPQTAKVTAGSLYFVGAGAIIPIHPIAVYQEDDLGHESVGILNKTTRRTRRDTNEPIEEVRRADYLDYATGENLRGVDAREALTSLLGRLRGKTVSLEDEKLIETETASATTDDPVDEVMSSGAALGDFELLEEVGRGGMGIVYRARQRSLHRVVALKVLPPTLAADPTAVERFKREVAALARCDHPNVIKVFTSASEGDRHYFAMEYVEGVDLAKAGEVLSQWRTSGAALRGGHLAAAASVREPKATDEIALATGEKAAAPVLARDAGFHKRLATLFAGAAHGLHHLHEKGVVHRDIKPGNLMLTIDGERVVIMDLGLAKLADEAKGLTKSDVKVLGTLRYMPPEQLVRKLATIDARVDVYALGASLYELATGQPLLQGETEAELVHQVLAVEPVRADKVDRAVPKSLATIIAVATAKDPKHRYADARALALDLEAFAEDRPIHASPPGVGRRLLQAMRRHRAVTGAVASLVTVSLIGALGWWWYDHARVSYCATVVSRRGVLTCAAPLSGSEQQHRASTYQVTERRGRVVRVAVVNARNLPAADVELGARTAVVSASWDYAYRDDGRVEHVVVSSPEGDFLRREVFSDDGTRLERHDLDDQPQKIEGSDVSVQRLTFDASGFVTKITFANIYGSPRTDSQGAFGYTYEVDAHGLPTSETALSAGGTPAATLDGWVKRTIERDALGHDARSVYFDADGKATNMQRGYAERASTYGAHGELRERVFRDARGQPALDHETPKLAGTNRVTWERDEHGDVITTALFGMDGRPTLGNGGWASKKTTYDDRGRVVAYDYFGVDGKPLLVTGYTSERFKLDGSGRIIEVRYFGIDGKPTTCEDGYATWSKIYDPRGNVIEENFLGIDERPTRSTRGFARVMRTFDARQHVVSLAFFGVDGAPARGTSDCATWKYRFDERGNGTEFACFGLDGNPHPSTSGWVTRKAGYDERGNEVDVTFFNAAGAPFGMNGLVARETSEYDDRGDMVKHAYFGVDGKPVISKLGYSEYTQKFDVRGYITDQRFFGVDHQPISNNDGVAGMVTSYDEHGNEVEQVGLGIDGKPIANKYGFVFNQWVFDARGKRLENHRLDADRRPVLDKGGQSGWRKTYDDNGNESFITYLGVLGQPAPRADGALGARVWASGDGRVFRRVAFDAQNQPIAGSSELAELQWKTVDGHLAITDLHNVTITDAGGLAAAESKIAAWSMGQRMAVLRDTNPTAFHGSKGALVVVVAPDGQANRVGLLPGDVVLDAGGHAVNRPQDVQESIDLGAHSMLILRDGKELHLDVAPGNLGATLEPE